MTRIAKLYAAIAANPRSSIPFRDFERLLAAFGFYVARIEGSHRQYAHAKVPRALPVQPEGKDAKRYQVKQLLDMVQTYGLELDDH